MDLSSVDSSLVPTGVHNNIPFPLVPSQHFSENLDHFSENMEDFSNELFSSFFDDPMLVEKNPLLDMDLDPPTPGIQAEHSYSLSGDSAPQSPLMPVKTEDNANGELGRPICTSQCSRNIYAMTQLWYKS